ncbi:hypothetical protein [Porcincola intestinalis]|uniref:Uncharacterized protein n=1 Tax=Porcincola intestinalis TaxID=2606632 RepID=A0A6L5X750_9FIRM|nr:hypothetical protein [Porcincola intestinalis]MCI6767644.1 hypothetical protein [Lachnospiraceae bacterium]MDD7060494.1 hypothetical protein [Porcincola intestinalis]MDY5282515.1 hypothetical protein [Porcincola intestinalis]MSS15367.1 hypothetical protein [Porcincola intestinalis]
MKFIIFLISVVLFWAEWLVIRKATINKFIPIIIAFAIGLPLGATVGLHLVAFPLLFILLAWILCEVEDRYFKRKGLTDIEKSKLKDL